MKLRPNNLKFFRYDLDRELSAATNEFVDFPLGYLSDSGVTPSWFPFTGLQLKIHSQKQLQTSIN